MTIYKTADSAWRSLVGAILENGSETPGVLDSTSVGSNFGTSTRPTRELLVTSFGLSDIRQRLVFLEPRTFRLAFAIAQTIWAFSGSNHLESLTFYQPRGKDFSDDGLTVRSAIGKRIFRGSYGDQLEAAIAKLKADPSTRRALLQIYVPEDSFVKSRDISCTLSIQFFVRDGKVHSVGHMRSQSAYVVLPYDLFLITMLHEYVAVNLRMEPGIYWHVCNSAHIYADELEFSSKLSSHSPMELLPMPKMTLLSSQDISSLVEAEGYIRSSFCTDPMMPIELERFNLSSYWNDLILALIVDLRCRMTGKMLESEINRLVPAYRQVLLTQNR